MVMANSRGKAKTINKQKPKEKAPVISLWQQPWVLNFTLIGLYFILALIAYWPVLPGDPSRIVSCPCGDPAQSAWFLAWTPYALSHGLNPFITHWINVPYGANLTQNTLMPLLGLLTAPLTSLAGPIASFNLVAWLAFPLSATALFYVVRRFHYSRLAAFIAGLLYGFSPYMIGQGWGHVMLTFTPLLPLIVLTSWELLVRQSKRPYRLGLLLAAEVTAQFFINPEILAQAVLIVGLCVIVLAFYRSSYVTKERLIYALRGLGIAAGISIFFLAYPVWLMTAGPQHFTGPNFAPGNPYRSDLSGLIVPTTNEKLSAYATFRHYDNHTAGGDLAEVGDYVGLPLIAILSIGVIKWRRNRWLVFCTVMALLFWIGSLGPRLMVYTHRTPIILPFAIVTKLPLLQDMLPSRLSLGEWFFISLAMAIIISEWQKTLGNSKSMNWRRYIKTGSIILLTMASFATLLPSWPYPAAQVATPPLFKARSQLLSNQTALTYPYPLFSNDRFMLWQAISSMQFKLVGAYIQNPSTKDTESELPPLLQPPSVQEWLASEQGSQSTLWPTVRTVSASAIQSYLRKYDINVVIVDPRTINAHVVTKEFDGILGPYTVRGEEYVWSNVQVHLIASRFVQ